MNTNKETCLYLDSVIMDDIRRYSWLISGVTTTPTFFKRENIDYITFISDFRKEFPDLELHIEALGPNSKETEKSLLATTIQEWFDPEKVVIKIPVDFENLRIVSEYSKKGIKFNTHLIFNPCQAYLAAVAGTTYVCPLIGRYVDNISKLNKDGLGRENDVGKKLLTDIVDVVINSPSLKPVKVMASSIRTTEDFQNSVSGGADVITVSTKILETLIRHEYTDKGVKMFLKDMGF